MDICLWPFLFSMTLTDLLILTLAAWRIANLIVDDSEEGPFGVLTWFRHLLGIRYDDKGRMMSVDSPTIYRELGRAVSCMWCLSLWIGLLLALIPSDYRIILLPFALSAGALIVDKQIKR